MMVHVNRKSHNPIDNLDSLILSLIVDLCTSESAEPIFVGNQLIPDDGL